MQGKELTAVWPAAIGAVLLLGAARVADAEPAPRRPPNIVFILLDNVGQEWFGCYGSEEGQTPEIDALARTGVRFAHCYTPPVCSPSRVQLLTGRYPFRTGWTLHHDAALYGGGGLDPKRETVFPRLLQQAGYVTGLAGKWQVNNLEDEPNALRQHGFDEHLVWPGSIDRGAVSAEAYQKFRRAVEARSVAETREFTRFIESRYWDPALLRNGRREVHQGKFGPDLFQEYALDFIRRHRDRPFLLYYPMVLAHGRTASDPVVPTPLNRKSDRAPRDMYGDMVRYADGHVGEVVRLLDKLKLRERTIVFVATDNGTERNIRARRNGQEVSGGLYTLTEAGGAVPLVVNCPAQLPGGRIGSLADFTDVLPTLVELAGAKLPKELAGDGRSLASFLRGQADHAPREWILNQYHQRRVVRDRRYKLYSTGEFYDLLDDALEATNLVDRTNPMLAEAHRRLKAVLASLPADAKLPFEPLSQSAFQLRQEGKE